MMEASQTCRTYSRAPVQVSCSSSALRRRQPGGVEPHQRRQRLRHPVGDHRHGAQHDADLQQRHRHRYAFTLASLSIFFLSFF